MPDKDEEFVKIGFIARKLGTSPRTINRYIDQKGLPAYKPGGSYLFYWSEVEEWLEESKRVNQVR